MVDLGGPASGASNPAVVLNAWGQDAAEAVGYTDAGAFVGAELLPPHRLPEYRAYRDTAQAHAVPFSEYWERRR
ncbi:hypothetical protein [Streptomyces sp. NPDC023838]|uniref:hypothetical protein n=1 Tax=Streptomyces sp. NPDC023838 TaxID=3154325 RepID=UPI0033E589D1